MMRSLLVFIPKGKHLAVQEGDYVKKGDPLDGSPVPHDILRVWGLKL